MHRIHMIFAWMSHNPKVDLIMLLAAIGIGIIAWSHHDQAEYKRNFEKKRHYYHMG